MDPVVVAASPALDEDADPALDLADRIARLEQRIDEQDDALRRVLTLLVDWVEADRQETAAASVMAAGAAEIREDHVPIRPPAAWDHAA